MPRYPRIGRFRACCVAGILSALMPAVLLADSEEVARLTFAQLVDSIRADSDVTQTMKSHNGKEVEVRGFIIPAGPPDLSFFMLSRVSALGNYCCEVPVGQDETVYVFAAKEVKIQRPIAALYGPRRVRSRHALGSGLRPEPLPHAPGACRRGGGRDDF